MTFDEFIKIPRSEKITLVKCESSQFAKIFTPYLDGFTYYRDVDFFISSVKDELSEFTEVFNIPTSAKEYFFNKEEKRLYLRTGSFDDPRNWNIVLTYQHFFSTAPVNLPFDLNNGETVEYLPLIESIGSLGQQLDDENTGIVLESSSSVKMINSDSYFDDIYDTHIWENKKIDFYLWSPLIPVTEAKKIFSGLIESKSYGDDSISFRVKDFVYKLQGVVKQPLFSVSDGRVADTYLDTPKRRVYGRVKQLRCVSTSSILEGYSSYPVSGVTGSSILTGSGSTFLANFSAGDEVSLVNDGETFKFTIDSVDSNTQITLSEELEFNVTGAQLFWVPSVKYRGANRAWNISGHKLFEASTTITNVSDTNRFIVDNTDGLMSGDTIYINGISGRIRRISGNQVVTENSFSPLPLAGDTLSKSAIYAVRNGSDLFVINRDFTLDNTSTYCNVVFNQLAEFNVSKQRIANYTFTFTSGSRSVTTADTTDLRQIISINDWIKQNTAGVTNWYEVLEVKEKEIILRTNSAESGSVSILYRSPNIINDESLVTVDCIGMGYDFGDGEKWIKTPSDVVRHLIEYDAGFDNLNLDSFQKANDECDHIMSLISPDSIGSDSEKIKDVLTKVNNSCLGSVYQNNNLEISFSIQNSKKPDTEEFLSDSDILDWSSTTTNTIVNEIEVNYRPFTDINTQEDTFETVVSESDFVNNIVGIVKKEVRKIYLYDDESALTMAQRISFFNSLSLGTVTVKTKLNLHNKSVNDKLYISLDRLFKRYGGRTRKKIGVISSIKKDGFDNEVSFNDLGNVFNRVPSIAPDTEQDYALSSEDSRAKYGYIVDNLTLTPDDSSELELGNNLIG